MPETARLEPGTTSRSAFVGVALDLNGQRPETQIIFGFFLLASFLRANPRAQSSDI